MTTRITLALSLICLLSCALAGHTAQGVNMKVQGESLVLAKTLPANFCFDQIVPGSLTLRSTFVADRPGTIVYTEGADYTVDYAAGTVTRTEGSRILDYSGNGSYGMTDFDHTKIDGFHNHAYFVWADYRTTNGKPWAQRNDQRKVMAKVRAKLTTGGPFKIASYGDSITAGGEASEPDFRFQARYAAYLRKRFPKAQIEVVDVSISGYSSNEGIAWFDQYLGTVDNVDLVLVGWGMNDHNVGMPGIDVFQSNLVSLNQMIRERKGADVILFSAFPPNDNWHYGSHRMGLYAEATKAAAAEAQCAYVDVFASWEMVLARKIQPSMLGNNINHPNDFGHWLYEQAFEAMKF